MTEALPVKLHRDDLQPGRWLIGHTGLIVRRTPRRDGWFVISTSAPASGWLMRNSAIVRQKFATRTEAVRTVLALMSADPLPDHQPAQATIARVRPGEYRSACGRFSIQRARRSSWQITDSHTSHTWFSPSLATVRRDIHTVLHA